MVQFVGSIHIDDGLSLRTGDLSAAVARVCHQAVRRGEGECGLIVIVRFRMQVCYNDQIRRIGVTRLERRRMKNPRDEIGIET